MADSSVGKGGRRITERGRKKQQSVLDAAEQLFSEKGYDATTIRDIAELAKAELGSITYHFESKEDIFNQVLGRRADEGADRLRVALKQAKEANGHLDVEIVLATYATSLLWLFSKGGTKWLYYSRLVMFGSQLWGQGRIHPEIGTFYLPVKQLYLDALQEALPSVPAGDLVWAFDQFQNAFTPLFEADGSLVKSSSSCDLLTLYRRNVLPFYLASFQDLAKRYS